MHAIGCCATSENNPKNERSYLHEQIVRAAGKSGNYEQDYKNKK
jgi:hypothetical protein